MNKRVVTYKEYLGLVREIARQVERSGFKPDYIVGLTRGGLYPGVLLSQYFDVPLHALEIKLRDHANCESNLWMAEDALGNDPEITVHDENDLGSVLEAASDLLEMSPSYKNILVVDDINDTGATLNWLMDDWRSGCHPNDDRWDTVWNINVKFAVLFDNLASKCNVKMDYIGEEINKAENDVWIDFPWEDWWKK